MEREQRAKHTETYERKREPDVLLTQGNLVGAASMVCNFKNVERLAACTVEDSENAAHKQRGTSHKHKRQLHGRIFLVAAAPYSDEKVHRYEGNLVEHEHREQVYRDKESEHTG